VEKIVLTGAPGRPGKSMHLIEAEHERRIKDGEAVEGIAAEAEILAGWVKARHPAVPPPSVKTITNRIGKPHRAAGLAKGMPARN
jgi:hypothetical protein